MHAPHSLRLQPIFVPVRSSSSRSSSARVQRSSTSTLWRVPLTMRLIAVRGPVVEFWACAFGRPSADIPAPATTAVPVPSRKSRLDCCLGLRVPDLGSTYLTARSLLGFLPCFLSSRMGLTPHSPVIVIILYQLWTISGHGQRVQAILPMNYSHLSGQNLRGFSPLPRITKVRKFPC